MEVEDELDDDFEDYEEIDKPKRNPTSAFGGFNLHKMLDMDDDQKTSGGTSGGGGAGRKRKTLGSLDDDGDDQKEDRLEVQGAGSVNVNGIYYNDGQYRARPRYKHFNNDVWIVFVGNCWWIQDKNEFVETAGNRKTFYRHENQTEVVPGQGWQTRGGKYPAPRISTRSAASGRGGGGDATSAAMADKNLRKYSVRGAGVAECNGVYVQMGEFAKKPQFKQVSGGIGYEMFFSYLGAWSIGKEGSTYYNNFDTADLPPQDDWKTVAFPGKEPAPIVRKYDAANEARLDTEEKTKKAEKEAEKSKSKSKSRGRSRERARPRVSSYGGGSSRRPSGGDRRSSRSSYGGGSYSRSSGGRSGGSYRRESYRSRSRSRGRSGRGRSKRERSEESSDSSDSS